MCSHLRVKWSQFEGDDTFPFEFIVAYVLSYFGSFVEVLDQDVERDMHSAPSACVKAIMPAL